MTVRLRGLPLWLALGAALALSFVLGLCFGGAEGYGAADVLRLLAGREPIDAEPAILEALVYQVRLPRVLLLLLAGAALSAAGAALQAVLQNPLASPGVLGVSSGASVGAVSAYASGAYLLWTWSVPLAAFGGALLALVLVFGIARASGRENTLSLVLTGVAVASLGSAIVSLLLLGSGQHRVHEIFAWLLGSADNRTWEHVGFAAVPVLAGIAGLMACVRLVDALALGEEQAQGIGVDVARARIALLVVVALTAGGAVSVVGPIAFVGLMVPHLVRALVGAASRRLLPAAALGGGAFLVLCDLLSRVLSRGAEVPVGVVTSLSGVVFFLVLLHRMR